MYTSDQKSESKKAFVIYLILTLGVCFLFGLLTLLLPSEIGEKVFEFFRIIFTPIPVLAAIFTRLILKDKSSWNLDIRVWRKPKALLLSAFLPGLLVLLGAAIYYIIYPAELFPNVQALFDFCAGYGLPPDIAVNSKTIAVTVIVLWLASAFMLPIHFLELGEELGWRGYLLPKQLSFMSVRKAVLTNGVLWGLAHAPLIFFGFNYGLDYPGAPATGILLMTAMCVFIGICMSYSMIKTDNCMYASIIHSAFNVACDMQILSVAFNKPLIGPTPVGIVGMLPIIVVAVYIFCKKLKPSSK